jgi:hypothetical protein
MNDRLESLSNFPVSRFRSLVICTRLHGGFLDHSVILLSDVYIINSTSTDYLSLMIEGFNVYVNAAVSTGSCCVCFHVCPLLRIEAPKDPS